MRKPIQSEGLRRRFPTSARLDAHASVVNSSCSDSAVLTADDSVIFHRHQLEQDVRSQLMAEPTLNFTSLVVRRIHNGLCLEGVLETNDNAPDVARIVRRICGVSQVLDHLVVHRPRELPRKG